MDWIILKKLNGRSNRWTVLNTWKAANIMLMYEKFAGLPEGHHLWIIDLEEKTVTLNINKGETILEMDIKKYFRKMSENKKFRDKIDYIKTEALLKYLENGKEKKD